MTSGPPLGTYDLGSHIRAATHTIVVMCPLVPVDTIGTDQGIIYRVGVPPILLLLTGPPGTGKSGLVRAGLGPRGRRAQPLGTAG